MQSNPIRTTYLSPIGMIHLTHQNSKLLSIDFLSDNTPPSPAADTFSNQLIAELATYFKNPQHTFRAAFQLTGSPFQQRVWRALQEIPSGQALTYGELAKKLNSSPRAIGQACRTNPVPIFIPCHRVIAKNGTGGYAGKTGGKMLDIKQWLLAHENLE